MTHIQRRGWFVSLGMVMLLLGCSEQPSHNLSEEWHYLAWNGVIYHEKDEGEMVPTKGIRFVSLARTIDKPIEEIPQDDPKSDPIRCVAAYLRAAINQNPEAYVEVSAPAEARNPDGTIRDDYEANLGALGYRLLTEFVRPKFPIYIHRHYRWGGMHGTEVTLHYETRPPRTVCFLAEECMPGIYRQAPEKTTSSRSSYIGLRSIIDGPHDMGFKRVATGNNEGAVRKYLEEEGKLVFLLNGLWGDTDNTYPVYGAIAGDCIGVYPEVKRAIREMRGIALKQTIKDDKQKENLAREIVTDYSIREFIKKRHGEQWGYRTLTHMTYRLGAGLPVDEQPRPVFVLELLPEYVVFFQDPSDQSLDTVQLSHSNGTYKASLFTGSTGLFRQFLHHPLIQEELMPLIEMRIQACQGDKAEEEE